MLPENRLQILMTVFNRTGQGTYWRAYYLARSLVAAGHSVTLMATSPTSIFRIRRQLKEGIEIIESPDLMIGSLRSGWDPWNIIRRIAWLRGRSYHIVHAFEGRPVALYPALNKVKYGSGVVLIMDWCDWFSSGGSIEERTNPLTKAILRPIETHFEISYRNRANGATVINNYLRNWVENLGVDRNRVLLLRNGSNLTTKTYKVEDARSLLGLEKEGYLIGFVGGTYARDASFMAEALKLVRAELPNTRLVLAGCFNRDFSSLMSDNSSFIQTGQTDIATIFAFLSACNLCWLPLCNTGANRGRLPLKLNDYMSVGRAVVSTAVGDITNIVLGNALGIVTQDDPRDFSKATINLLQDPDLLKKFGESARRTAETVFSWDILASSLEKFYKHILLLIKNE